MRLDHLLSKETSRFEIESCNVLRLAFGRAKDRLFNLEGTRPKGMWLEIRGFSSAGRAPALQAGGHRFDPGNLHQIWARSSAG